MENSYNTSKLNSSGNKTISQNSKVIKGFFSPTSFFKTELNKKDFAFDGFNTNKNNKMKFEKFEFDQFDSSARK